MPRNGDSYVVELKNTHVNWGLDRKRDTRAPIPYEGFIPIPRRHAEDFNIVNSNVGTVELGINLFRAYDANGESIGTVLAAGSRAQGDKYAKNLQGYGDLKLLGKWLKSKNAEPGDNVRVTWISKEEVILEVLGKP